MGGKRYKDSVKVGIRKRSNNGERTKEENGGNIKEIKKLESTDENKIGKNHRIRKKK